LINEQILNNKKQIQENEILQKLSLKKERFKKYVESCRLICLKK